MYSGMGDFCVGVSSRPRKKEYNIKIIDMFVAPGILDLVYYLIHPGMALRICRVG